MSRFCAVCRFGEKEFGPIRGRNKKEVKTQVARLALDQLKSEHIDSRVAAQKLFINADTTDIAGSEVNRSQLNDEG